MSALKAGVVGAGAFGRHHVRKYAENPSVRWVGLYDADLGRAAALTSEFGGTAFESPEALFAATDVVTIATPPSTHAQLGTSALAAGCHVLMEKPLAAQVEDGAALIAAAARAGRVLAVGHQERLVFAAMGLFTAPVAPTKISAVRAGPWTGRSTDVSVTLDLMIHDLDLALTLCGGVPALAVRADGVTERGSALDRVRAEVTLANGTVLALTASRVEADRARTMRIDYPTGAVAVDFLSRQFEDTTGFGFDPGFADTPTGKDPLGANVAAFVNAAAGISPRPAVTGAEGLAALELALAIDAAAG